ncbi:MAG: hypothetical protein JWO98_3377 [Frankiales bacterium]|nr:hypothetical protein [Frankiales bacterium]
MALLFPMVMSGPRLGRAHANEQELAPWLEAATKVEMAHRDAIAWLRSRLPGYPMLPAPQLAPNTPLTTREFTWRLSWQPGEQGQGLQFRAAPSRTAELLEVSGGQSTELEESARWLARAFSETEEWLRLDAATRSLTASDRDDLQKCRSRIKRRLVPAAVDEHDDRLALPRDEFRSSVVLEELESLQGGARGYAFAFDAMDQLIEYAVSDVFGQLLAYGPPQRLSPIAALDFNPGAMPSVSFSTDDSAWLDTCQILWLDSDFVADAVMVTGLTISLDPGRSMGQRITARLLTGSGEAWA